MRAIVTYHSIDESGSPISVPAAAFEAHCRWLSSGAVRTRSLCDILGDQDSSGDAVAVTFDDGFVSARRPIELLLDAGITPTMFVVTRHVGGANDWGGRDQPGIPRLPLMTWDDLQALCARGLQVEAHSRTHPHLSRLSAAQLDDELEGCREDLQRRLGVRSTCLAYPYGDVNSAVAARAANGFAYGLTTEMSALGANSERMLQPRLDMYYYRTSRAMESWGSSGFRMRLNLISLRRRLKAALPRRNR